MLPINPEFVRNLISRAKQFQVKEAATISETPLSATSDFNAQVLTENPDDAVYQELVEAIEDLEPDQKIALVALMWIGRGDYDSNDWQEALTTAAEEGTISTADYLLTTPCVAEYLEEGLIQFGYEATE